MLCLLALVLAFVCFKLEALTVLVSVITYAVQAVIMGALLLVIYGLLRWWRNRQR